jgi:hypothetical protein
MIFKYEEGESFHCFENSLETNCDPPVYVLEEDGSYSISRIDFLDLCANSCAAGEEKLISFTGILNPTSTKPLEGLLEILSTFPETEESPLKLINALYFDISEASELVKPTSLEEYSVERAEVSLGSSSDYTITFTTINAIPTEGVVQILFDPSQIILEPNTVYQNQNGTSLFLV